MSEDKMIQEKLAEIEARRAARRAAIDAEDEAKTLARAEAIDAAEEKYGPTGRGIAALEAPDGSIVIVRKPAPATYRKFQDSKENATDAGAKFVRPCLVEPTYEVWEELLKEYPGLLVRAVRACTKLAGHVDEEKT